MRAAFAALCLAALAACDSNTSARPPNGSISDALQRGMTEQQVAELSNNRVPDRVIMKTCGTETSAPFPFKVYYGRVTMTRSSRSFSRMPGVSGWSASASDTMCRWRS